MTSVNSPAAANAAPVARKEILKLRIHAKPKVGQAAPLIKPGSIDPFRQMVRDLNK